MWLSLIFIPFRYSLSCQNLWSEICHWSYKIRSYYYFKYYCAPSAFLSSVIPAMIMLHLLMLFHGSWYFVLFFFFSFFFPLLVVLRYFYWPTSRSLIIILTNIRPIDEPIKGIFFFVKMILVAISFDPFQSFIILLTLSISSCLVSTFSIRLLNILSIIILNYFSLVSIISVSGSDAYFASSNCIFNFSLACLTICCVWKLYMLHWVIGTKVNRILVWGFILIWLELFCV